MNIITTTEQLTEMVSAYADVPAFAFDVETVGPDDFSRLHPLLNEVTWIAFATTGRVDVIPMGHPNGDFVRWDKPLLASGQKRLDEGKEVREQDYTKRQDLWTPVFSEAPSQLLPGDVFKALKPLMFSDQIKVGHNIKFDLKAVAKYYRGVVPPKPYFDTMLASFILNNRTKNGLGLADCAKRELDKEVVKGIGHAVEKHSFQDVAKYAAIDAETTWQLYEVYETKLKDYNLTTVWKL